MNASDEILPHRFRKRRALLAGALLASIVVAAVASSEPVQRHYREWRGGRFAREAGVAFREGRYKSADLALKSALVLTPNDPGVRLADATLAVRLGRRTEAALAWQSILSAARPPWSAAIARSLAFQLLAAGWWPELADLSLRQLDSDPEGAGLWLSLAAESLRFSRGDPAGHQIDPDAVTRRPSLAAYAAYGRGDLATARRELTHASGRVAPYSEAVLRARLWLRLGETNEARRSLLLLDRPLARDELQTHEMLLGAGSNENAALLTHSLFRTTDSPAQIETALVRLAAIGLGSAHPAAAAGLSARLRPLAPRLTPLSLVALWLYAGAAKSPGAEQLWRQLLESRLNTTLPKLMESPPGARLLTVIVDRVPLPFELACSLLALSSDGEPPARLAARP